jgi:hypothetical protein
MSRDIVDTLTVWEVGHVEGATRDQRGRVGRAQQKPGRPRLRPLAAMGTPAGHPLQNRRARGIRTALTAPAYQHPRHQRRAGRHDRAATQNPGQSRLRRRRGHHRRTPHPRPRRHESPCPIHDLAHPDPPRISSSPNPTNDPAQHGNASPPPNPTNSGKPTSPTGSWPTAPRPRSSTCSTITPVWPWPASLDPP